ncbi:MAG: hypothetical protein ACXIVQ_11720 [Acidimicrobiales bacterium]
MQHPSRSPRVSARLSSLLLVVALVAAACGDDEAESPPTTDGAPTTTASVSEGEPGPDGGGDGPDVVGSGDDWGSGDRFTVVGALEQIPADIDPFVEMGDMRRASELADLFRPAPADEDEFGRWMTALTGGLVEENVVFVPYVNELGRGLTGEMLEEFAAELGWSVADVDAYVAAGNPPNRMLVIQGEELAPDVFPDLPEVEPGVVTAGEGRDLETDLEGRTAARPLGAPLRMAASGDVIAVSSSTATVSAWRDGAGRTLADDPGLAAVAGALDDLGVYAAVVLETTTALAEGDQVIGIGWTVVEGAAEVVVVYGNPDGDDIADDVSAAWEDLLANGPTGPGPLELLDVSSTDDVVVATVSAVESHPAMVYRLLINRQLPGQVLPSGLRD